MKQHLHPWRIDLNDYPQPHQESIADFCASLLSVVNGMESVMRQFHPPRFIEIQRALRPFQDRLKLAGRLFREAVAANGGDDLSRQLQAGAERMERCLQHVMAIDRPQDAVVYLLKAIRQHCRAQECLYPLHVGLKPVGRYFLEASVRKRLEEYRPRPQDASGTGLFLDEESGSCLYIPETYDGQGDWPLVVALHGGSGRGRDFIWLWLREARSRRFLLLAPSSAGRTWSFDSSVDAGRVMSMIDSMCDRWRVDRRRMLLTGMSDGAIYTLTWGLQAEAPFAALAPIAGVLHPVDLSDVTGKRIYLVHGTLDWMFSIQYAHRAWELLRQAGADITFREIRDLSHTYPREENGLILSWFDPSLSLG